jgi:hypothetical protein
MKAALLFLLLLLVALLLPFSHSARHRASGCEQVPGQRRAPIRVLRTPQAPKVVRTLDK